mgnify:CR=1 FL=1
MSGFDENIDREYFELNGFFVRQLRKYQVQSRKKRFDEEIDMLIYNPKADKKIKPSGFQLFSNDIVHIHRAIVVVKAWHSSRFTPAILRSGTKVFDFLKKDVLNKVNEYFDWEYQTNLRPHVFTAKAVIKSMIKLGGGSVINVGSIGWMRKNEKTILYGVFKSSLHGLTHGLAKRFGKDRIRVNTLVPGWTMTKKQIEVHLDEEGEKKIKEGQCLPDKVLPEDIANAALFLASDDSKMITSQDIVVDGGWT